MRSWRLDCPRQTLALVSEDDRLPVCVHWGARLPDGADLTALAEASRRDITGGMLDVLPEVSVCPEASRSFAGQPGLRARASDGAPLRPAFRFAGQDVSDGALGLHYADEALGLRLTLRFAMTAASHMITASTHLESDAPITLDWLAAPVLPAPEAAREMIDVSGRWCNEFQLVRTPWGPGARLREAMTGRSGHEHFPGLIVPAEGATNTQGAAWGWHLGWSGGHRMVAEELPDGRRQVQFGKASGSEPVPGTAFDSAQLYLTYSGTGLNGIGIAYQRHLRDEIVTWPHPDRPRPVHYNCWEAIYFDHDLTTLTEIADSAAALGAERFVLDDGWFGKRDDDTTSLGDWQIDRRKWPDGLTPLIDHVKGLGMTFGLWFEPEMVNTDSDLYRAHPDWMLGPADQIPGRQQYVLDIANPAVLDHLFTAISDVLAAHDIDYIKWDHNRLLPHPDAAQTEGIYDLLSRLREAFPAVEIESCASGGGRIDFGIMQHCQRVWLSDSIDALDRLRMQNDAALFLPSAVTGSHIGTARAHTTLRTLDVSLRAWVAAQRHLGFEVDPRTLSEDEAATITRVTAWWKANRDWMRHADILRLDADDPQIIAEMQIARDGAQFVAFAGKSASSAQIVPRPLRLTGLEPDALYRIDLANRDDLSPLSRGPVALKDGAVTLPGAFLMGTGLALPHANPGEIWVLEGTRL